MPKKGTKTVTTIEEMPVDLPEPEPQPDPEPQPERFIPQAEMLMQDDIDLKKYLEGLGGGSDVVIKINKWDTATNRPRFMYDTDVEGASESAIQANLGEGRYLVRAFKEGHILGSKTVYIGPPLNKPAVTPPAPVVVQTGNDGMMNAQFAMLQEQIRSNQAMMLEMIKAMGTGNQRSGTAELAEIMVMMKPLMAPPAATAGGSPLSIISEAIPLVKQLIDLGSGKSPDEDTSMGGIIKEVIREVPNVFAMFQAAKARPAQQTAVQLPVATPGVKVQLPGAVQAEPEIPGLTPDQLSLIRNVAMPFLKGRAKKNANPITFVDYVLETLDDDSSMAIVKLLDLPFEQFAVIDPEIMEPVYRPWFENFFGELKDAISKRIDAGGDGGDDIDPPDDEKPSPVGLQK
jgi:hypothetical protein